MKLAALFLLFFFTLFSGGAAENPPPGFFRLTILHQSAIGDSVSLELKIESSPAEAVGLYYQTGGQVRTKLALGENGFAEATVSLSLKRVRGKLHLSEEVRSGGSSASATGTIMDKDLSKILQIKAVSGVYPLGRPILVWSKKGVPVVLAVGDWKQDLFPPASSF